ncbi:MAG: hypothetical protein K2L00_00900 [Muribaculaceae bacterium]|nr:hypothetical protein [Muribaculaceae bacterium]
MKKIILLFLMAIAMTSSAFSERTRHHMQVHETGASKEAMEIDRNPINLPIAVYYDSDTNILEVWCDNDNIQAEIYVYDESGAVEAYSPYMNVALILTTSGSHSIHIIGDGWEAEGSLN